MPYLKLNFANGPGYYQYRDNRTIHRIDPLEYSSKLNDFNFQFPATIPMTRGTHGGDDAAVYANGPYSHLFTGTMEQNTIPHLIAYASCIGNGITACNCKPDKNTKGNARNC